MEKLPTIKELRQTIQPDPKKETVWYAKYVIRKISIYFTWLLLHTPLSANQATVIQAILGIAGAFLLAFGGRPWAILALILIQLGYVFDCIDGEIARYRKKPTINGIFLDSLNHAIVIPIIFLGLVIYSFNLISQVWILIVGMILLLISANPVKKGMLSTLFYMLERKDNPKYKYENLVQEIGTLGQKPNQDFTQSTNEVNNRKSVSQIIFHITKDISEYPTSMNVITLVVITDLIITRFIDYNFYFLPIILTVTYLIFLTFKELVFFFRIYTKKRIEKKFLNIIK